MFNRPPEDRGGPSYSPVSSSSILVAAETDGDSLLWGTCEVVSVEETGTLGDWFYFIIFYLKKKTYFKAFYIDFST